MCTIITSNKLTKAIERQILEDNNYNPHGISLLLLDEDYTMLDLNCFDVLLVIQILRSKKYFQRFWLHQRYATTCNTETIDCHNYRTQAGYYIQHNGILHDEDSSMFRVDSQLIGYNIDRDMELGFDIEDTLHNFLIAESYLNAFIVAADGSHFYTLRSQSGTLYTDGKGNYSSNIVSGIRYPVTHKTMKKTNIYNQARNSAYNNNNNILSFNG